ncbi:MAG: YraN family protein [Clostridia bacterium]|nr:YraN family protein [Clostridia bacterium]
MTDTLNIGKFGEDAAAEYLARHGFVILDRNLRFKVGELDIVALDKDGCTVFVEVKTRKNADYGYASEFVDRNKQKKLIRAAEFYSGRDIYMRFDIIEVYYKLCDNKMIVTEINHIENAF